MSSKNKKREVQPEVEQPVVEINEVVEDASMVIDPAVFETKLFVEETDAEFESAVDELKSLPDVTNEEPVEPCVCEEPCTDPCVCQETPKINELLAEPILNETIDAEMTAEMEEEGAKVIAEMVHNSIMEDLKALAPVAEVQNVVKNDRTLY